jgi:hypothetical protein
VCAIANMAVATLEWTTIIWDQNMMALFSIFDDKLQLEEAHEYFCLWRQEELDLLWTHLKLKHNNT